MLFERRYGLDTSDHVGVEDLGYAGLESVHYEPSGWTSLNAALSRSEVGPDDVFADLGSGKGRVVFNAALRYPFKRVIGVELAEGLHKIAERNIERNRDRLRCKNVELVRSDLRSWPIPEDLTIGYMHNPIVGGLFAATVERLKALAVRRDRPVRLIYVNPVEHEQLLPDPQVREIPLPDGLITRLLRGAPGMIRKYELG